MVAKATPATFILKQITKSRFNNTFINPDKASIYKGVFVSPIARRLP